MERGNKLTTRQAWEVTAQLRQADVNELLNDLQSDIDLINTNIANPDDRLDDDELRQYAMEAVEYLNDKWQPYIGAVFLVSGDWYIPQVEYGPNSFTCTHVKGEFLETLFSRGFTIGFVPTGETEEDEGGSEYTHKVGMSFTRGSCLDIGSHWMAAQVSPLYFAELHEVSLQYVRPGDQKAVSSDLKEVIESIDRADSLLKLHLTHQDSNFYQLSAKKQQQFLQSMIDSIHDTLPMAETLDQIRINQASLGELYIRDFNGQKGLSRLRPEQGGIEVTGSVRGVTIIGIADGEGQISSPGDLLEASRDISLIISPDQLSHQIQGYVGEDIIVPFSQLDGASFELF